MDASTGMVRLTCSACGTVHVLLPDGSMAVVVTPAPAAGLPAPAPGTPAAAPEAAPPTLAKAPAPAEAPAPTAPTASPLLAKAPAPVAPAPVIPANDLALEAVDLPPVKCPKCGHRQHDTESCHRCGLVFAMVKPGFAPWDDYGELARPHLPQARTLWAAIEAAPGDDAAHEAFVAFCKRTGLLLFAAARYRWLLSDLPGHPVVDRHLAQVTRDATAMAGVMRSQNDEFLAVASRARTVLMVAVAGFCVIAMIVLGIMISRQPPPLP